MYGSSYLSTLIPSLGPVSEAISKHGNLGNTLAFGNLEGNLNLLTVNPIPPKNRIFYPTSDAARLVAIIGCGRECGSRDYITFT